MPRNSKKWPRDATGKRVPLNLQEAWLGCRKVRTDAKSATDKLLFILDALPMSGIPMPRLQELVRQIYNGIVEALPYVVCQTCNGEGECEECKYKGWISRYEHRYQTEEESNVE